MKASHFSVQEVGAILLELHRPLIGVFRAIYLVLEPSLTVIVPKHYLSTLEHILASDENYSLFISKLKNDK